MPSRIPWALTFRFGVVRCSFSHLASTTESLNTRKKNEKSRRISEIKSPIQPRSKPTDLLIISSRSRSFHRHTDPLSSSPALLPHQNHLELVGMPPTRSPLSVGLDVEAPAGTALVLVLNAALGPDDEVVDDADAEQGPSGRPAVGPSHR